MTQRCNARGFHIFGGMSCQQNAIGVPFVDFDSTPATGILNSSIIHFCFKHIGLSGFLFFLAKGFICLAILLGVFKTCSAQGYFDFDEVIHYHMPLTGAEFSELLDHYEYGPKLTLEERHLMDFQSRSFPLNNCDSLLNTWTKTTKLRMFPIDSLFHDTLRTDVFYFEPCTTFSQTDCIPVYRDMLVFKKEGKFSGLASICFECDRFEFIGAHAQYPSSCWGQQNEFDILEAVLKQNRLRDE